MPEAPFRIEDGDTIAYNIEAGGAQIGYFVRWNKDGTKAVIKKPSGGHTHQPIKALRPVNDGRMIKKRGWVYMPKTDATKTVNIRRKK